MKSKKGEKGDGLSFHNAVRLHEDAAPILFERMGISSVTFYRLFKKETFSLDERAVAAMALGKSVDEIFGTQKKDEEKNGENTLNESPKSSVHLEDADKQHIISPVKPDAHQAGIPQDDFDNNSNNNEPMDLLTILDRMTRADLQRTLNEAQQARNYAELIARIPKPVDAPKPEASFK